MPTFSSKSTECILEYLSRPVQSWLFGAGISFSAGIPLIAEMTRKIHESISKDATYSGSYLAVVQDMPGDEIGKSWHVETLLTHLVDLMSVANRRKSQDVAVGNPLKAVSKASLEDLHKEIRRRIVGYVDPWCSGDSASKKALSIQQHRSFFSSLNNAISVERNRRRILIATTNYDTLLEDAAHLEGCTVADGFSGGSVGCWRPRESFGPGMYDSHDLGIVKLHGSIDWYKNGQLFTRKRIGIDYFEEGKGDIFIYPQATKYMETQLDPFSLLIDTFRAFLCGANAVTANKDVTLGVCGYSWGDEHINRIIFSALLENARLTVISFNDVVPPAVSQWQSSISVGATPNNGSAERLIVAHAKGISHAGGKGDVQFTGDADWWRFDGLSRFIESHSVQIKEADVKP